MEERRKLPRKYLMAYSSVYEHSTGKMLGYLCDLTFDGLMVISKESLEIGKETEIRIDLPETPSFTENNLKIKIYGTKASIEWHQQNPNNLIFRTPDQSMRIIRTGVGDLDPSAQAHTRLPAGHPEGYLEAFANIYRNFAKCIRARIEGDTVDPIYEDYPTVEDGVRGMQFIYKVVESSKTDQKWLSFD